MRGVTSTLAARPVVAIVGTRRMTPYGERVTRELATALARGGACIVSGLAMGIDGTAHRAALDANGVTMAVLGTGLNRFFPLHNRALQLEIAERGLLITELEADDHGWKSTFRKRNRLIAALAAMTIVVEAPLKSGALITADYAEDLDRIVAGVPGPIDRPQSTGPNFMIRNGAQIITSVEDALALVGLTLPPRAPRSDPEGDEGKVWNALAHGALDIDALCSQSGLPAARCLAAVTTLEIAGSVECALTGLISRR